MPLFSDNILALLSAHDDCLCWSVDHIELLVATSLADNTLMEIRLGHCLLAHDGAHLILRQWCDLPGGL